MTTKHSLFGNVTFSEDRLDDTSIHEIRKCTKQIRAHLALLRKLEGKHPANEKLRHSVKRLARMLCAPRDRFVLSTALANIAAGSEEPGLSGLLAEIRSDLDNHPLSTADVMQVQELLHEIEEMAPSVLHTNFDIATLNHFLASGMTALKKVGPPLLVDQDFDDLHDWRKQVKTLMYQYLLIPSPSKGDLRVCEQLELLGSSLGQVNDLRMLKNHVLEQQHLLNTTGKRESYSQLLHLIDEMLSDELGNTRSIFGKLSKL